MNISVDSFFQDIIENTTLIWLVWEYEGEPAIAEEFPDTPVNTFITLCDENINYQYCAWTSRALSWYVDFTLRIVGKMKSSRSYMRNIRDCVIKELRDMNTSCVHSIRIDSASNNLLDPQTERPYSVINARAYFR